MYGGVHNGPASPHFSLGGLDPLAFGTGLALLGPWPGVTAPPSPWPCCLISGPQQSLQPLQPAAGVLLGEGLTEGSRQGHPRRAELFLRQDRWALDLLRANPVNQANKKERVLRFEGRKYGSGGTPAHSNQSVGPALQCIPGGSPCWGQGPTVTQGSPQTALEGLWGKDGPCPELDPPSQSSPSSRENRSWFWPASAAQARTPVQVRRHRDTAGLTPHSLPGHPD